ncbi:hypothetical protein HDU92_002001, partial [Lobulomyces angularis]
VTADPLRFRLREGFLFNEEEPPKSICCKGILIGIIERDIVAGVVNVNRAFDRNEIEVMLETKRSTRDEVGHC